MTNLAPYLKAITGALVAGLASAQQALLNDGAIDAAEGVGIAIAALTALALVWVIPNRDPEGEHQDDSVQPPDYDARILGKAFGSTFGSDPADGDPHRP